MKALLQKIRKILRDRKVRRAFTRIVGGVSALAVFITTYALILPAITMETEAMCGIEAHQHDDSCYSEELICEIPESDGHHHTDECYTITRKLICELQEHAHTQEAGCYDEEGNLICELQPHEHDDQCYKEVRTLTCGLEESDGHHHSSECYKKVLTCGKEVHTHSEECYKDTSRAIVASTSATAEPALAGMIDSDTEIENTESASDELTEEEFDSSTENAGLSTAETVESAVDLLTEDTKGDKDSVSAKSTEENIAPSENADGLLTDILSTDETASNTGSASDELATDGFDKSTETDASPSAGTADAAAEATTNVLPEEIQEEDLSDGFIPSLDPLYMEAMLTKETAFYYYHPEDGEMVEDSSAIINWKKASEKTELAPTDLVRMYLPYTIPAGSLNQTNQIARYRLPAGIRFTDDQIINVNQNVNGVAASCLDGGAAEDANDGENNYEKYLGAEAVEGKRRPDQELREGETEYVSAVVKVENIFDDSTGEYEGQDLIFIFTPYTIEENQNVYDRDGDMTAKGRKVSGWFAMDFNMSQIDWVEDEVDEDLDNTTIGKTASFLFAAEDKENDVDEIRRELRLVENTSESNTASDTTEETDQSAEAETAAVAEEAAENAAGSTTGNAAEVAAEAVTENSAETETASAAETAAGSTTENAAEVAAEAVTENSAETETASAAETADEAAAGETAGATSETSESTEKYTSGTLEAAGDEYKITLDYAAEAQIPVNADLQVREITEASDKEAYEACLEEARKQVAGDDKSAVDQKASRFFDIEIIVKGTDEDGKETITKIEPAAPVSVNIQLTNTPVADPEQKVEQIEGQNKIQQTSEPTVLHFAEEGVEAIDSTVDSPEAQVEKESKAGNPSEQQPSTEIQFEAKSFSVYGVVYTTITKTFITASGETYEITVTYDQDADIPDGADLEVQEILEGTSEYQDYLNNSADELGTETDDISFARFFDITIVDKDGTKVEPKTRVTVQIAYKDAIEIGQEEYLSVVHFADKGTEIINDVDLDETGTTVTYIQDSFSVTGTVVSGNPRNGNAYMLIVDYEGIKYIINNDGTLIPVETLNNNQINTDYPMLWTYNYQYGGNFRIASEATGFDANNVAAGFYYRYIDPNVDSGLTEEDAQHPNLSGSTQVNYNNNLISSARNNNLYIGVSEEGGTLHIVGNQQGASKAAKITLYNPGNVRSADPANHTVNHIDISISGEADVDVPLAYGIYYYKEGNTWHKLIVGQNVPDVIGDGVSSENTHRVDNHTENLKAGNIHVTSTDMKSATITAKRHDTGAVVNDAFYITGYSANHSTQYSTDQVRIEGSFKVADINPVPNNWQDVNSYDTRSRRLDNIIDYTVSADKRLNLPLTYTVGGNTFALYKEPEDEAEQVSVVATVNLSATFNYWDHEGDDNPANDGNECPPLQPGWGYDTEWKNGGIQPWGISGMDFVLHGKGTAVAKVLALEITKTLKFLDENGSVADVQYNQPITFDYEVFTDQPGDPSTVRVPGGEVHDYGTYKALNSTEITVRPTTDGSNSGHVYDYDVTDGMYYVREVRDDNFPTELTIGGDTYRYVSTNIRTEYSYRHNQYRDRETGYHQMHEVGISSETADLNSIPEVLGEYTADDGNPEKNEFLEFYFENVYRKNAAPPPPEPIVKTLEINLDKKWRDGDDTTAPTNGTVTFKLHRIATTTRENGHDIASPQPVTDGDGFPKTLTISSLEDWKMTIPNLTYYESDTQRTYERTYKYYLEETERTGDAERYGVPSFTNGFGSIHNPVEGQDNDEPITVEVENKTGNVLRIQKRWLNVDPDVAPNVTIRIWRMALNEYGNPYNNSQPTELEGYSPQTLTNDKRVQGENWWQVEIPFPSETTFDYQEGGQTHQGHYIYYISEDNLGSDYLDPRFITLSGDQAIGDYDAYSLVGNGQGIGFGNKEWGQRNGKKYKITDTDEVYLYADSRYQQDTTMAVMNAPNNTFHHVYFSKEWYKYENGTFVKSNNGNDTKNYAIGIQIYQRVKSSDNTGEWHPFAHPIYIGARNGIIDCNGHNYIMDENNPFKFNEDPDVQNGVWKWLLRDEGAQNGFPKYAMVNGQKVYYEYEAREIGVYTTENGQKVSSVDQLQRVYDYSNIQNWYFDESAAQNQNNGPKAINVEAGELKVTKTWQGGHTGSKIYFKVYRGNEDITASIVSDPESYGLTEHQVLDDGNHKALIVTSDGTNWATLLIQGLAEAPASGGSAYVYSIKETGYSEADGTDWWDGEVVTNPDGSTRKDPQGIDIVAHVSDLLTGYQIDSGGNQSPINGRSPGTTVVDDEPHTITVNNNYVEKYKDFEFSKVWENGAGEFQTWPADISSIKVDLYAKAGTGEPVKIKEGIDFYVTPPTQDSKQEFTWNGVTYKWEVSVDASGKIYTFKIPDLPAKDSYPNGNDYEYSAVEQSVTDYTTRYGHNVEEQKTVEVTDEGGNTVYEEDGVAPKTKTVTVKSFVAEEADSASNGKVISNKKDEPQTGTLNIIKAVSEGADASGKTFSFEVTLKNADDSDFTNAVSVTDSTRQTATSVTPNQDGKITVTVTGTGTAVITDIPDGIKYTVSEPTSTIPSGWKQEGTVAVTGGNADQIITTGETETARITNTPTDFEFSKVWKNANGTQYDTWQKDITVTLYRKSKKSGSVEETVKVFSIANGTAAINPELNTSYNADISINRGEAPEIGKENKGYKYTITGAGLAAYDSEGYEYDYYVKEADVTFYTTTYGVFDGEGDTRTPRTVDGYSSAADGGVIINTPVEAVELPSTGGSGTHLIYLLGSALAIFATALLGIRRTRHGR